LGTPERLTAKGATVMEELEGLKLYLRLAEADRLKVLQSPSGAERSRVDPTDGTAVVKLYEKLLPWAIVFGLEEEWRKVLGAAYATTPTASSDSTLTSALWFTNLALLTNSYGAHSFATTPPAPSGGSSWSGSGGSSFGGGFSGGGFSGGGGGGGGGGGW
ncbi:MAG: DUF2207 domain-containing protein, partial [Leifsonia sp.]